MLWLLGNQMRYMSTAFIDEIQIDEFDCIVPNQAMFDLFGDNWESLIESDQDEWILIEDWYGND